MLYIYIYIKYLNQHTTVDSRYDGIKENTQRDVSSLRINVVYYTFQLTIYEIYVIHFIKITITFNSAILYNLSIKQKVKTCLH